MSDLGPIGNIYLLGNPSMPGLYKIGYTTRHIDSRIKELSRGTSVPTPFFLVLRLVVHHPALLEKDVHRLLSDHRHSVSREFFNFKDDRQAAVLFLTAIANSDVYIPRTMRPVKPVIKSEPKPVANNEPIDPEKYNRGREAINQLKQLLG